MGHLGLPSSLLSLGTLFLSFVVALAAVVDSSAVGFIFHQISIYCSSMMKTNYYRQCRPGTHQSRCFRRPRSFGNLYRFCWWSCRSWLLPDDCRQRLVGFLLYRFIYLIGLKIVYFASSATPVCCTNPGKRLAWACFSIRVLWLFYFFANVKGVSGLLATQLTWACKYSMRMARLMGLKYSIRRTYTLQCRVSQWTRWAWNTRGFLFFFWKFALTPTFSSLLLQMKSLIWNSVSKKWNPLYIPTTGPRVHFLLIARELAAAF